MNFYFSIAQLIKSAGYLENNLNDLAARAFRISPRNARANRILLEKCAFKSRELRKSMEGEFKINKITLRRTTLLFQLFHLSLYRMMNLGEALSGPEESDGEISKVVRELFPVARSHFKVLKKSLAGLSEIPQILELEETANDSEEDYGVLQRDEFHRQKLISVTEKAIKVYGEEHQLLESLYLLRSELLEARKILQRFNRKQVSSAI